MVQMKTIKNSKYIKTDLLSIKLIYFKGGWKSSKTLNSNF